MDKLDIKMYYKMVKRAMDISKILDKSGKICYNNFDNIKRGDLT